MRCLPLAISLALAAGATSLFAATPAATPDAKGAFTLAGAIAAPDARWDFASWDSAHGRLLVAHGADVLVVDPSGAGTVQAIGKLAGAHGVLAITHTNSVLVTSGHDDTVRILDETSGAELSKIAVTGDPDAVIASDDGRRAYVMGADSGAISVLDLTRNIETGRIVLKAGLEVPVLINAHLLAVNNERLSQIELADLATGPRAGKAAGVIALPGCKGPTGLAYAPEQGLALSACANGVAALVDVAKQRMVRLLPIGQGPDTAIWQGAQQRFLVPCGRSGTLSIIALKGRQARVLPAIATQVSARTAALDPVSGRLFLPAAQFQSANGAAHPAMLPGSFHIVVMAPVG